MGLAVYTAWGFVGLGSGVPGLASTRMSRQDICPYSSNLPKVGLASGRTALPKGPNTRILGL